MIADRHLHTWFSEDSEQNPEESIKKAIRLGMKDMYITDHYDIDFPGGLFLFDPDKYFRELTLLKEKYAGQINVHLGVELGLQEGINSKIQALLEKYPFEYKIGSIHLLDGKDPYERDDYEMSDEALYRRHFECTVECLKSCSGFDTLGHMDYIIRYGYQKEKSFSFQKNADLIEAALEILIQKDIALEVNTSALRKGIPYAHPCPEILRLYKEMGGKRLAMGSDAHCAEDIGSNFVETMEFLKEMGFSEENFEQFY